MPRLPARVAAAEPWRPLTAARPEPDETHSTFPPRAATCAAKSADTDPLNDTIWRMFAEEARRATEANWGDRAAAAGSGETRASYEHAAAAISPMTAHRDTDLTIDIGCLGAKGGRKTWRRFAASASRSGRVTSRRKNSRIRDPGRRPASPRRSGRRARPPPRAGES